EGPRTCNVAGALLEYCQRIGLGRIKNYVYTSERSSRLARHVPASTFSPVASLPVVQPDCSRYEGARSKSEDRFDRDETPRKCSVGSCFQCKSTDVYRTGSRNCQFATVSVRITYSASSQRTRISAAYQLQRRCSKERRMASFCIWTCQWA